MDVFTKARISNGRGDTHDDQQQHDKASKQTHPFKVNQQVTKVMNMTYWSRGLRRSRSPIIISMNALRLKRTVRID